jgi:hypothetical protein
MASVPNVERGFFPLDEELELLPGSLTPHGYECLVRLGSWMPFGQAGKLLEGFLGIRMSQSSSRRYAEKAGAVYVQLQTEEVERLETEMPPAPPGAEKVQISADGATVPLLHGVWAEVRTLVIGEVQPAVQEKGEMVVHTRNLSYFSHKIKAEEFQRLALVEMHRRGVENAKAVAAIQDGAEWEQSLTDYHCPDAIRILDLSHAAEHVSAIGNLLYGEHTPESQSWLQERLHHLKQAGPEDLLREIRELHRQQPESSVIASNLAYLEKRSEHMQYPTFQAQGWPIGSGIVESANKIMVEARLKGSGMHWAEQQVNPMLALRNIICSDRWQEEWPRIEAGLRQQDRQRRRDLHQSHRQALPAARLGSAPALDATFAQVLSSHIHENDSPAKPKPHPWRGFSHGKALFQPTPIPKN